MSGANLDNLFGFRVESLDTGRKTQIPRGSSSLHGIQLFERIPCIDVSVLVIYLVPVFIMEIIPRDGRGVQASEGGRKELTLNEERIAVKMASSLHALKQSYELGKG